MALARKNLVITDDDGNIVNGASVEVRRESPGLPLVSVFSDRDGLVSLGNPFTAADGSDAGFHVAGGSYQITATLGGFTKTWRYEPAGLAQETDAEPTDGANAGFKYNFNSATSGDPGTGGFLFNNATFGSITALNISETDADGNSLAALLATWDDGTSSIKGTLMFVKVSTGAFRSFAITGTLTDNGAYDTFSATPVASGGTISNGDECYAFFLAKGDKGDAGAGSGDVVGPASSVNSRPALFDGTTGKLLKQHSAVLGAHADFNSASQAEAEAGTSSTTGMTPQRTLQAIKAARSLEGAACMVNGIITSSASGTANTFAVKTQAGADPSSSDPVYFIFRGNVLTSGGYAVRAVTSALSLVISSGSTLGTQNGVPFKIWLFALDNSGTVELGAVNCCDSNLNIYPLGQLPFFSTTAEGGAGGADSALVPYSTTARATVPYAILGYCAWESGLGTAGTWNADPTRIELFHARTPLPGTVIQRQGNATGSMATGTTTVPNDDTIPQNNEGDQYMTQAITPTSAANLLRISSQLNLSTSASGVSAVALFQDSVANAIASVLTTMFNANPLAVALEHIMRAATTSATTFKMRAGNATAGTTTFNGVGGAARHGGVIKSFLNVEEIMT